MTTDHGTSKSTPKPACQTPAQVIAEEQARPLASSADALERFEEWLAADLDRLEKAFRDFWTPNSYQGTLGRGKSNPPTQN